MASRLEWHGNEVRRLIEEAGHKGLVEAVAEVAKEARQRTPVMTRDLVRSQRRETKGLTGVIYYTDSKAAAAHENLHERTYRNGKQAKFLESAANDKRDDVVRLIAEHIKGVL